MCSGEEIRFREKLKRKSFVLGAEKFFRAV